MSKSAPIVRISCDGEGCEARIEILARGSSLACVPELERLLPKRLKDKAWVEKTSLVMSNNGSYLRDDHYCPDCKAKPESEKGRNNNAKSRSF